MNAFTRLFATTAILLASGMAMSAATVPEPSTLCYGKVMYRAHGNEYQLREGTLTWILSDQSGGLHTYTTALEDIGGVYSYRIGIPHQVLASGLSVDPSVIPLAVGETRYDFVSIEVDGQPAEILWSETDFLKLLQSSRAATHRIDLQISFDLLDTDGDGMPDWWEQLYGLDWQTPDGNLDGDGDGWNHLAEFLGGTDPTHDDRAPSIQTLNLAAYGEANNGVWLRSVDADSLPADLIYTLTEAPAGGELHLLTDAEGGLEPGAALEVGATFTQEQLNQGLLAYLHTDTSVIKTSLSVMLSDGVNEPFAAQIGIGVFPPSPSAVPSASAKAAPEWWRDENSVFESYWGLRENVFSGELVESALLYLLGKNYGWTIWDERSYTLPVSLAASGAGSHFLLGGAGDDVLVGSPQDDILAGGPGTDRLNGGLGIDLFIVSDPGLEIIEDFNSEVDVLDLSDLSVGQNGSLDAHLRASFDGTDTEIGVDGNGDGSGFTDAVIRLEGVELSQDDLNRLWSQGQLLLGSVQGLASVSIEDWPLDALEEGYSTANLTLRRNGPANLPLTVFLSVSGSATNGSDYTTLPASVTFPAGKKTVTLPISPLLDGASENVEQINLGLANSPNYVLGASSAGQINIVDAKQRFSIHALHPASVVNGDPAYLQIVRQGPKTGVIQLLLTIGGSGVKNVDFTAVPTLVTFADNQASLYLPVEALSGGTLAAGETSKTLTVSIRPALGDEYLLGLAPSATVRLLSNSQDFETWIAEAIPGADSGLDRSGLTKIRSPRTGLSALLEYAASYGLKLDDGVDATERELLTPQLIRDETGTSIEFSKRLNDLRLQYIVECSSDMVEWHSGSGYFEPVPLSAAKENAGRVRYRVLNNDGAAQTFMRVRVDLAD